VSSFLGKLGNPEQGGLALREFKHRQALHKNAEIKALKEIPDFIHKAHDIYGYKHFINDAGGSVCELDDPEVIEVLDKHTLLLYIQASAQDEQLLIQRAEAAPKPLYYREAFLEQQLAIYMQDNDLPYVAMINPDAFVRWIFPRLFNARIPRYESIAAKYGYTVSTDELKQVENENDFIELLEHAVDRDS
jgi:hypothetical protein